MNCCNECFDEGVSQLSYGGCRNKNCLCHHPVNRPTTSPEKNFNEKIAEYAHVILNADTENDAYGILHVFVQITLDNQKKQVLAVLEGMKRSNVVTEPDSRCPAFNQALTDAITKITNL